MSSTNKTANMQLSQFVGSDKPTFTGDYNADMGKIDAAMKTQSDAITVLEAARPHAHVYQSATVSVPNAAQTYLTFDTVRYDTDGMYSAAAPGRLTVKHAGIYLIGGYVCYSGDNTAGARGAAIRLNGSSRITNTIIGNPAVTDTHLCVSTVWHLAAGDYVELGTYQSSGSAKSSSDFALSDSNVYNEFYLECMQPD